MVGVATCCEMDIVGAVVSTVKLVRDCAPLDAALPAVSAKLTVQSPYVPSLIVPIVRVFVPLLRLVGVEAAHDPEKDAVPASLTDTVYDGVLSVVGVGTWTEMDIVGAVVSTVNEVSARASPADWPTSSAKLTVQSEYEPSASVLCTVMVCSPLDPMLVGDAEEHDPPYVAAPDSLTVILKLGV